MSVDPALGILAQCPLCLVSGLWYYEIYLISMFESYASQSMDFLSVNTFFFLTRKGKMVCVHWRKTFSLPSLFYLILIDGACPWPNHCFSEHQNSTADSMEDGKCGCRSWDEEMLPIGSRNKILPFTNTTSPKIIIIREMITSQSQMDTTDLPMVGMLMEQPYREQQGPRDYVGKWRLLCPDVIVKWCNCNGKRGTSLKNGITVLSNNFPSGIESGS